MKADEIIMRAQKYYCSGCSQDRQMCIQAGVCNEYEDFTALLKKVLDKAKQPRKCI